MGMRIPNAMRAVVVCTLIWGIISRAVLMAYETTIIPETRIARMKGLLKVDQKRDQKTLSVSIEVG